jgi:hypothetical protein
MTFTPVICVSSQLEGQLLHVPSCCKALQGEHLQASVSLTAGYQSLLASTRLLRPAPAPVEPIMISPEYALDRAEAER